MPRRDARLLGYVLTDLTGRNVWVGRTVSRWDHLGRAPPIWDRYEDALRAARGIGDALGLTLRPTPLRSP